MRLFKRVFLLALCAFLFVSLNACSETTTDTKTVTFKVGSQVKTE